MKGNFYTTCDPTGNYGNVHLLLRNMTEYQARQVTSMFARRLGQTVLLKPINQRGSKR